MSPAGVQLWITSNLYTSIAWAAVPLFVILSGALLLQPSKVNEPLTVFFKKRFSRIGFPLIFWGSVYFVWRYFVNSEALTTNSVLQGVLTGPYFQFWFLYLLIGLYLLTPLLRVITAYASWNLIKYFLVIWFVGTGIVPLFGLYEGITPQVTWFRATVFALTGLIGYFILGAYITKIKIRTSILCLILALSLIWTILGSYFLVATLGESYTQFFHDASSANVIITSIALFLILATVRVPKTAIHISGPGTNRVLHLISKNTLPIYLFHVIALETLQRGYLGFTISVNTMNPIIEIPLITALTLLICLAVIVPLKKIPYVKRLIG